MKINKDILYELYMQKVDKICDECDWVTSFGPREIVDIIADIIEKNEKEVIINVTNNDK